MAIYLDSNVLFPWRTFTELDRVALTIVAHQTKQLVIVPWLVAEEARANYTRSLKEAVEKLESALRDVNRLFDEGEDVFVEPEPQIEEQVAQWNARLGTFAQVIPPDPRDALEGLRREIWRVAPARRYEKGSGTGGRDAAIWLAIVRDHSERNEEGHFITRDGGFVNSDGHPRAPMHSDLDTAHELRIYNGISEFLAILGSPEPVDLDVSDLLNAERSVKVVLDAAMYVPRAIFDPIDPELRYTTVVKEATPLRVLKAVRYARSGEGLLVVDSEWDIVADLYHQPRDEPDETAWHCHEDVHLTGTIQLYLPTTTDSVSLPQVVNARLKSDLRVWVQGDRVWTMKPA